MSTIAPRRPPAPVAPPQVAAPTPTRPPAAAAPTRRQLAAITFVRFLAFTALVLYGLLHWARQVAPTQSQVADQLTLTAAGTALALIALRAVRRPRLRAALVVLVALAGLAVTITAAGVPLRTEGYRSWGELSSGIGQGLAALPDLSIPYRGLDHWVRIVVMLGGGLLALLAALLSFAPGSRENRSLAGGAIALAGLYGVAVVERNPTRPFLSGAGFALGLALLLGAERLVLTRSLAVRAIAVGTTVGCVALGLLLAPGLDAAKPWIDYRGLATDLARRNQITFDWNHSYEPLKWPRDGRELLRVKANEPAYWKAEVLTRFDGLRWVATTDQQPDDQDSPLPDNRREWFQSIAVTVRSLRSEQFVTAGFTLDVPSSPSDPIPSGHGSFETSTRPLKSGDTYTADVYTPRPTIAEMRSAGSTYPDDVRFDELAMELPASVGGPGPNGYGKGRPAATQIYFPAWGTDGAPQIVAPGLEPYQDADATVVRTSAYGRMYALAQSLKAQSSSPYDFARRVRQRVMQDALYTEDPRETKVPLDGFLFTYREGYCQQFSGAMALLLRMGGVPARIGAGFTPGAFDAKTGEYVVRDLDAHSWVEVYFPKIGWTTFDPTPAVAPPRDQSSPDEQDAANSSGSGDGKGLSLPRLPDPKETGGSPGGTAGGSGSGGAHSPWLLLPLALVLGLLGAAGSALARLRRPVDPLEELRAALALSGRPPAPGLTLHALEGSLADAPAAQGYVRKLRQARYAATADPPAPAERAALREELGSGLGFRGRLKAWWALPPIRRSA